jgi:hypothetical protein
MDVDVNMFRNVFRFWTDASDVDGLVGGVDNSDNNASDIKYYVKTSNWLADAVINPAHAIVTSGAEGYEDSTTSFPFGKDRSMVKHDFLRHIAKHLFNTHLGVDLFTNEGHMTYNIAKQGHLDAWGKDNANAPNNSIWSTLAAAAVGEGSNYYTNETSTNKNLTRELLGQMSYSAGGRARLADITANGADSYLYSDGTYAVPFYAGDSVNLKVTLNAAPGQHALTGVATPVPPKTYKIRINLVEDISVENFNVAPTDDKLTDGTTDVSTSYVAGTTNVPKSAN